MVAVQLGKTLVTDVGRPYVIAEIGVNHEGSLDVAKRLIDLAARGGANAAKFQSYKADTLASKNSPAYWDTTKETTLSQHDLFKKYDSFNPLDYEALSIHADKCGIDFLSTPFDDAAVDYLTPLVPFFKIASADITNTPLLRRVGRTRKPVILSTGASTFDEVDAALLTLESSGATEVVLLHCILNYPTENRNAHLRMITGLRGRYPNRLIGYSDHTIPEPGMTSLLTAWLLGAVVLEKHFTHDKTLPGNDHYHAMDVDDLRNFCRRVDAVDDLLGDKTDKSPIDSEESSRLNARRSIVLARSLPIGHQLVESDLTYKRPGTGVSPVHWDEVIGRSTSHALTEDHVLQWDDLA
jgi:N-acetylneuraminate synthase